MFHLKIVLLFMTVSSSLYVNCNGNIDIVNAVQNAFSTEFDQIVKLIDKQTDRIEDDHSRNTEPNSLHSRISENYNDTKCYEQMQILTRAFNATEPWALRGKLNICIQFNLSIQFK